jgi:uncharacterized protein
MWFLLILMIITEVLMPVALAQYITKVRGKKFLAILMFHSILSLWLWLLFFKTIYTGSFYDTPQHIWIQMQFMGMFAAVVLPRALFIIFHFAGKLFRLRHGGYSKTMSASGLIIGLAMFSAIAVSTLHGRFNFRTESITMNIKGLPKDLDGLRIVQISDLHLSGFYHHSVQLMKVMDEINGLKPDIIINTGDFVTFGWREFGQNDTILLKAKARFGSYAIMGNHDFGSYDPDFTKADKDNNVLIMNNKIRASGYTLLNNEFTKISIGSATIGMIGITTMGRHRNIIHGNVVDAAKGLDSVDLKILLSHDPNQWDESVKNKTDIDITFSGHTHGMQMGIITKNFRWSPAKRFYPHWNGMYSENGQIQYVNRGLGVLAVPFRIWMPPEITVITLKSE